MRIRLIKKVLILMTAALSVSMVAVGPLRAADNAGPDYLKLIYDNTTQILNRVNSLPNYITKMLELSFNLQKEDDSTTTQTMQSNFASIGQLMQQDYVTQNSLQLQVMADLVNQPVSGFNLGADQNGSVLKTFPYINDLAYSTMLGLPPAPKGAANPYNYLKNAAGFGLMHDQPGGAWQGGADARQKYRGYYNTIMAIQSFNAYVLSNQYADLKNGNTFTNTQLDLAKQASDSNWIATIASEEMGKVLRQLLMFQSQSYVLMTQMIQTQKQMVIAQAMTNSAIIAGNLPNEYALAKKAQGR